MDHTVTIFLRLLHVPVTLSAMLHELPGSINRYLFSRVYILQVFISSCGILYRVLLGRQLKEVTGKHTVWKATGRNITSIETNNCRGHSIRNYYILRHKILSLIIQTTGFMRLK